MYRDDTVFQGFFDRRQICHAFGDQFFSFVYRKIKNSQHMYLLC